MGALLTQKCANIYRLQLRREHDVSYLAENWGMMVGLVTITAACAGAWAAMQHRVKNHGHRIKTLEQQREQMHTLLTSIDGEVNTLGCEMGKAREDIKTLLRRNGGYPR